MIVTIDLETHYGSDYSLRKMSEIAYIMSPLYQTILAAIQVGDGPCEVFIGHDAVAAKLATLDWSKVALLSHNARFDGSIVAWRFGHIPALYLDTLSMARATTHAVLGRSSLDAVGKYLGLPNKGDEVVRAIGKRLEDFAPAELRAYADYCVRDALNCRAIYDALLPHIPKSELILIDTVMRMFSLPQVFLDANVLATHLADVRAQKATVLAQVAHIDKSVFSSNQKFAALLQSHGVEPPQKISPATGDLTWAFAKNDRAFKELCDDPDQPIAVQAILAARLNTKSTIEETRTEAMLTVAMTDWGDRGVGWAAVPLKYYGAHTGRLSGDGGFNYQNFKRGSAIRKAVVAPQGYRIVHRDASQIEVRMLATLAKCKTLLDIFRERRDPYCEFASVIYGRRVTKADPTMRFVGKTCILGLGYQTGGAKLRHTLFVGNGGVSVKVEEKEATDIVWKYRRTYPEIPKLWETGESILANMLTLGHYADGYIMRAGAYPCVTYDARALWLPNGMPIQYPNLRRELDPTRRQMELVYDARRGEPTNIYGGKLTENVDQALSRIIVTDAAQRVRKQTGYTPFLSTHDSLDYCVPEGQAKDFDALLAYEFAQSPSWLPEIPLDSEGGWGTTLAGAEHMENC